MAMSSPASTRVILGAMAALFLFFLLLPSSSTPSTTTTTTTSSSSSSSSGSHSGHGAHVEPKPEPDLLHTPCANDCHGHGRCFMARCFCAPGYGSNWNCQSKWSEPVPECFLHNNVQDWNPPGLYADLCYEHPDYGIAIIPKSRWQQAQDRESGLWKSSGGSHDRADQHASFFGNYASLPEDLGDLLEVGCGPYTQSKWIIDNGSKKFQTKSITLQDPGIDTYISSVSTCTFKDGFLSGRKVKTINAGTEELRGKSGNVQYDTIVMINVLEHVWNVFEVLENVHDALKTGGILVFNTRVLYVGTTRWPFEIYHPIRLKTEFLDFYYSNYKVLERKDVNVQGWIESYAILQKIK